MRKLSRFLAYLTLSLLIHLGVSQIFAGQTVTRQTPRSMQVSLVSRKAPDKPVMAEQPKPKPRPKSRPVPRQDPAPQPVTEETPPEEQQESSPTAGSVEPVVTGPPHEVSAVDAQAVEDSYRSRVQELIRKNLKYPGNARRRGIEGTVLVRFTIGGAGSVGDIRIASSSGSALLDKASLETIRTCSFPPPPKSPMTLSVPLTFRLTEER